MNQDIRDLFKNNTLQRKKLPDNHRSEFLEKLEQQKSKKPKKRCAIIIFRIAASVALLLGLAYFIKNNTSSHHQKTNKLVEESIDTTTLKPKKVFESHLKEDIIISKNEEVLKVEILNKTDSHIEIGGLKKEVSINKNITFQQTEQKIADTNTTIRNKNTIETIKNNELATSKEEYKPSIKVNSDALLYAVTHSTNEVLAYYKENDLTRESVIASIEAELIKSKLNVDANELLTEIELGLNTYTFKEKLLAKIKLKIKELSNAIATN